MRSIAQKTASPPIAYAGTRKTAVGQRRGSARSAAVSARTATTKTS